MAGKGDRRSTASIKGKPEDGMMNMLKDVSYKFQRIDI